MQTEISRKLSANCSWQICFGLNELTNTKDRRQIVCVLSYIFFNCISGNIRIDRKMFCTPPKYKYKQKCYMQILIATSHSYPRDHGGHFSCKWSTFGTFCIRRKMLQLYATDENCNNLQMSKHLRAILQYRYCLQILHQGQDAVDKIWRKKVKWH